LIKSTPDRTSPTRHVVIGFLICGEAPVNEPRKAKEITPSAPEEQGAISFNKYLDGDVSAREL
jgi:hypothetical protein